jgi:hypothetical protein
MSDINQEIPRINQYINKYPTSLNREVFVKLIFGQIVKKLSSNLKSPCTESTAHLSRFCIVIHLGSQIKTKLDNSFDIVINF